MSEYPKEWPEHGPLAIALKLRQVIAKDVEHLAKAVKKGPLTPQESAKLGRYATALDSVARAESPERHPVDCRCNSCTRTANLSSVSADAILARALAPATTVTDVHPVQAEIDRTRH